MGKNIKGYFKLSFFLFVFIFDSGLSQVDFPKYVGYINDFAGVIPGEYKNNMEIIARELERKTGAAVVVVTVKTTGDMDYNEYANRLYERWGIGKKGVDEGVLILNAVEDRTIRIEVGYGLEGILPDGLCGEIRDRYITPFLGKGEYGEGLLNGMLAVVGVIAKDKGVKITGEMPKSLPSGTRGISGKRGIGIGSILAFIFFIMIMSRGGILPLLLLGSLMGARRNVWSSSGAGGFGGGFGGFGGGLSGGGGAGGSY